MGDKDPVLIWRFRTRQGSVRLGVSAPRDRLEDLHGELRGIALVADDMEEFLSLSVRAINASGGMIGDVMRQPWPEMGFQEKLRRAALAEETLKAASITLDAATSASDKEVAVLLESPEAESLRAFIRDLALSLDDAGDRFVADLAAALRLSPVALETILK